MNVDNTKLLEALKKKQNEGKPAPEKPTQK